MKRLLSGLLAGVAWMSALATLAASPWNEGKAAFEKGDYAAAIRAWETALAVDAPSAALYQNLALAQERAGDPVAAILSLQRARLLDPLRTSVSVDLSRLERSQGVPFQKPGWRQKIGERVPAAVLYTAGAVLFWAAAFWLLTALFRRRPKALVASLVVLAVGAGTVALGYWSDPRIDGQRLGVVVADKGASLLSAPADQSKPLSRLPAGSSVFVLQKRGEWSYCQSPDGTKGWLPDGSVTRVVVSRVES